MSATRFASLLIFSAILIPASLAAQDATGSIRGTVLDSTGSRIAQASIAVVNTSTGTRYTATSDAEGGFALELLPPGDYSARVVAEGMSPQVTPQLHVDIGAAGEYLFYPIKVNPFTFQPMEAGLPLSPLRAYAHEVPPTICKTSAVPPLIPTPTNTPPSRKRPSASPTASCSISAFAGTCKLSPPPDCSPTRCFRPPAKFLSSPTTSRLAPDWPTPSATRVPSSFAPDTASSSSASRKSTTRSSKPKTASLTPAFSQQFELLRPPGLPQLSQSTRGLPA
jgi:hypothetical protein